MSKNTGPVVPALYPFHEKNPYTAEAWPAGDAAAITGETELVISSVLDAYGHQSGLIIGKQRQAHCAVDASTHRATDEDQHPLIEHAYMEACFKAWEDAPQSATEFASRFLENYANE
jgi:hypothetical protein